MKKTTLLSDTMTNKGATTVVEVTYADLTDADAAQTLELFEVAAKQGVALIHLEVPEAFVSSDATLISTAITIGDGGSATRFLGSTELNAEGAEVFLKGGALSLPDALYVYTADDTVDLFVAGTAAKLLNTHTAGRLLLYFRVTDARLSQP